MGRITVGLLVLAIFASANAFTTFLPEGKELVYRYHAVIRAGTHVPLSYSSAFALDGLLHVQTDKNSSTMHFCALKYKMYNGEYDEWHEFEGTQVKLPKETHEFENPFKVVYDTEGKALGLSVQGDEEQYAVNIKRGIAAMMQMNTEKIEWGNKMPHAFHTKEHTLYGKGPMYYTVFPGPTGDHWTVKKMSEPHSNYHLYSHLSTNSKMATCDAHYDQPLSRDSMQNYMIVEKDGAKMMQWMESNGGIYYTPYDGQGYAMMIYMNQTLTLEKVEDKFTPMVVKDEKFHKGLNYYTADFNTMEGIADIFHGRRTYDQDKMLTELEEMLYDTMKYIKEYHLDMKHPDWMRGQLVNRMLVLMFQLDTTHLEAMCAKLMQKTGDEDKDALHVYYHMLPMIGTHASYMYMMKAMKMKKVKDKLALEWLQNMPFNVKEPNKMLLDHMSEMLNWGEEISMEVRKAAILCFGTFVQKALFRHNKVNHVNNWTGHEDHDLHDHYTPDLDLEEVFPGPKYYEKYLNMMDEKMKACKDFSMRSTYISAMFNTKMEKAIHFLWPIAKGELYEDNYLRLLAIKSMGSMCKGNEELIFEIFWPIMADYKQHTNLRIAAYMQIMNSHPSLQRLTNLFWQMQDEQNFYFYQFHYHYMKAVSHTTDPCMEDFQTHVKQILRYTEKPEYMGWTGFYQMDYMDTKYDYGHQFSVMIVKTPFETESTLKIQMGHTLDNAKFGDFGILMRVDGMEACFLEDVAMYMKEPTKMFNFEKITKAYREIYNNKDIRIDVGVSKNGQVIMSYHYDATNIKDLSYLLDFFVADKMNYVKKYFTIAYPEQTTIIMPTDMGFPALFKTYIPKMCFFDMKITKEIVNGMITYHYDTHLKESVHGQVGLSFYNPFVDVYQGVSRVNALEWVQPIYFDLSLNPAQQSMKLSWKRHDDPQKDMCGLKTHAATFTYVRDDMKTGILQTFQPKGQNWEMVSFGDEHRDTRIMHENDNSNTGFHTIMGKFESDTYASNMTIFKYYNFLHSAQHYHTWFGHWFLTRFHALVHSFKQPYPTANGFLMRSEVSKQFPVTNVDINLRFTRDYKRGDEWMSPAAKYNLRATYSVKNKDTTVKTWDANVILDTDMGHKMTTLKSIFSRIMPGQKEWRVCVDGTRKFDGEHIEGDATISMSHETEPKCTKDGKVMEIHMKGEKHEEQLDNKRMYGECHEQMWSDIHELNSLACYFARDSFRKWTYDFQTFSMPTEFKDTIHQWFDWVKIGYMKYFTKYAESSIPMEKDSWRIVEEFPMVGNKVDLKIYTHDHEYKFGGIPAAQYPMYKMRMFSTEHISPMFRFMHHMGWTKMCFIHQHAVANPEKEMALEMPTEWKMYHGESETDAKHGLWMKKMDDEFVALKMMHDQHSLEIIPKGHKMYEVMVDGKKLPEGTYQTEHEWFYMDWVKETGVVSITCMHTGSHIVYDGHHALTEFPNMDMTMYGPCGHEF